MLPFMRCRCMPLTSSPDNARPMCVPSRQAGGAWPGSRIPRTRPVECACSMCPNQHRGWAAWKSLSIAAHARGGVASVAVLQASANGSLGRVTAQQHHAECWVSVVKPDVSTCNALLSVTATNSKLSTPRLSLWQVEYDCARPGMEGSGGRGISMWPGLWSRHTP